MKNKKTLLLLGLITGGILGFQNCFKGNKDYSTANSGNACVAPASWFPHSQTPPPQEGANSPFANVNTTSNCDFHLWSWQKFLWLTQEPVGGRARFEDLIQVSHYMKPLGPVLILEDSSQAGTHTILVDKSNRAVYYSVYMDSSMYHFSKQYVDSFRLKCFTNGKLDSNLVNKFGYDTLNYPVGALELKAAWILTSSLEKSQANQFYRTQAILKGKPVEVALIGMHVVGRVINHPELIWATFEHKGAAPTYTWATNTMVDSIVDSTQVLSDSDYLLYNANTAVSGCVINKPAGIVGTFQSIYHVFDHGTQPAYPGILPNLQEQDTVNLANIKSINASVFAQLGTTSVWSNYEYYGSIWIDPTTAPLTPGNGNFGSLYAPNLRGSRALSNIAAETYVQYQYWNTKNDKITVQNSFNCLGCHGTEGINNVGYNLALSHMFNNALGAATKGPKEQALIKK